MKKLISKLKSKSFWVSVSGALTLILSRIGIGDASVAAECIITTVGSLLMLAGITLAPADCDKASQKDGEDKTE